MRIISDEHWCIEENCNDGMDNCFLMVDGSCVGGVDFEFPLRKWMASVQAKWDGRSDVFVIGMYDNRDEAIGALWDNRHTAIY